MEIIDFTQWINDATPEELRVAALLLLAEIKQRKEQIGAIYDKLVELGQK